MQQDVSGFETQVYSVSDLNAYIRALLESNENLIDIWVSGEISNLSRPRSGHIYFTLKDENAALRCVVWRMNASRLAGALSDGMLVEAHGYVSVYEGGGQYQLYVDGIRAAGEGRLYQQFLELKEKLTEEGLFDPDRKRPLPRYLSVIGVVTSPTGAAFQDMLNTLRGRYPLAKVVLAPAAVQGEAAPAQIVRALTMLDDLVKPDVIIVGRGGGSLEDLWAFNDEEVVRAVAASEAPVISGVGHETDFTLTDFAADVRAPTPTGAAVAAVPDFAEMAAELGGWRLRFDQAITDTLSLARQEVFNAAYMLDRLSPVRQVEGSMQRLDMLALRLDHLLQNELSETRQRLNIAAEKLNAFDPHQALNRGFALLEDENGRVLRSVQQVKLGQRVNARVSDGTISADVAEVSERKSD